MLERIMSRLLYNYLYKHRYIDPGVTWWFRKSTLIEHFQFTKFEAHPAYSLSCIMILVL